MKQGLPSVTLLQEKLEFFFVKENKSFEFLTQAEGFAFKKTSSKRDLVVLPDALSIFHHLSRWPRGDFHFWVLSSFMKNILVHDLGLSENCVSLIPRYELFPMKKPHYTWNEVNYLVYAGRDVFGKNLSLLKKLAEELKLPLITIGPGLSVDHGQDWIKHFDGFPAFATLSHYIYEDYSVSAAQAQASGWPILCPSWGAFNDLTGKEVKKLSSSPELLSLFYDEEKILKKWKKEFHSSKEEKIISSSATIQQYIDTNNLCSLLKSRKDFTAQLHYFYKFNRPKYELDGFKKIIARYNT